MAERRKDPFRIADRIGTIEISLIRQINALATPLSINLGLGEPNLEPDEELREMARQAAVGSWRYTQNAGLLQLRERIAAASGAPFDPKSEVCVTAGTEEGLYTVMQAFVETGDEVLVPDPGFVTYPSIVRMAGGVVVPYPLEPPDWQPDPAAVERLVTPRTRMIVVNSPSNPTGGVIGGETLRALVAVAERAGALVVSDEIYSEIHYGERPESMAGMSRSVIALNGISKSHGMTGLRIAWIVAARELMGPIVKTHQYVVTCASAFSQNLALRVMENERWNRDWLDRAREQFTRQREAALEAARQELHVPLDPPGGAFYLFVPVPVCGSLDLATSLATEAAVLTIPGIAFGSRGEGFLRVSFAASTEEIRKGIGRIAGYLGTI